MMSRKWSGFIFCKQVANAAAFELENAFGFAAGEEGEGVGVVEREFIGIDTLAGGLLDQIDGFGEDGEVAEAEKIHFQQAGALDVFHGPLRDDFVFVLHAAEGDVFGERDGRR